jgi:hypothetical protein
MAKTLEAHDKLIREIFERAAASSKFRTICAPTPVFKQHRALEAPTTESASNAPDTTTATREQA